MTNKLNDPFNPKTGEFRDNIRLLDGDDDTELRGSMKQFGWRKEFPAYKDERGVVLVGHRRLKIAKELKIEPVVVMLELGEGDEADAERLKIAIASNVGTKPMTKPERQRIAKYLYGEREWTMERIAEALDVTQGTISKDLGNLFQRNKSKSAKTASNPKGAGRPKGSTSGPRRRTEAAKADLAGALVLDKGYTLEQAAAQSGLASVQVVKTAVAQEQGRREVAPPPEVALSMSAQEKLDAAMRTHQRKLDLSFEMRVLDEVKRRIDEIVLPLWRKRIEQAQELYARRRGLMDKDTFNKIRRALHPDSRNSISDKVLGEAFDTFMALEKFLLNEKDSPTEIGPLPDTLAEWDRMRKPLKRGGPSKGSLRPR